MQLLKSFLLSLFPVLFLICCSKTKDIVKTRSFLMGVTPWSADFTLQEADTSYSFINNHCDIVSHHFDEGIPYEEAFYGAPPPAAMQQDISNRHQRTASGKKVFLSVSALNLTRKERSEYYSNSVVSDSIRNYWHQMAFNDPKVIKAYFNYISWLVDAFQPAYINYGVESNNLLWDPAVFAQYKSFLASVYTQLKAKYPGIPLMVSNMVDESSTGLEYARQLLPYTDCIALSSYPYLTISSSNNGNTNPALFPSGYYERFIELDKSKPLVISETGYLAEPLSIPSLSINKDGNEEWQNAYLNRILTLCESNHAKVLIWFCSKDYDAAVARMKQLGIYQDLYAFWKDTGLKDENGRERKAYSTWEEWRKRTIQ